MDLKLAITLLGTVITTGIMLYVFAPAAPFLRLIDEPDAHRKFHTGKVPLTGGISLFLALIVVFYVSGFAANSLTATTEFWPVVTATLAILLMVHAVDDIVELRAETRLAIDAILALFLCTYAAVQLTTLGPLFGTGDINLGRFSIVMTVFCFVAASNAFNMVDGIDSLCSGLGIIALLTLIAFILIDHASGGYPMTRDMLTVVVALGVAYVANMGLLGPRMRVFLGDSGARLIAFITAMALILAAQKRLIHPVMAYFAIAVPVCDCLALMATRMLHGRSPVSGDRMHLHHLLQDVGFSTRQTRLIILGLAVAFSICGLAFRFSGAPDWVITIFTAISFCAYLGLRFRLMRVAASRRAVSHSRTSDIVITEDTTDTATVTSKVS